MRYLAEIVKQAKTFMGKTETELKLLASGKNQSWVVVGGKESIKTLEDLGNLGEGALVIVNLDDDRVVKGKPELASQRIIGILQGFSRLIEKTKVQEEEIEVWKESMAIQGQELSRRELEMEARLAELENMEEEFNGHEELLIAQKEAERIKTEFSAKAQELEEERDRLEKDKALLEERIKESNVIDESFASQIQSLLDSLSFDNSLTGSIKEKLSSALKIIDTRSQFLEQKFSQLASNKNNLHQQKQYFEKCQSSINSVRQQLISLDRAIDNTKQELISEQESLKNKQKLLGILKIQEDSKIKLNRVLEGFGIELNGVDVSSQIDFEALNNMPLSKLEDKVKKLQEDLSKMSQFVSDQEEELGYQCEAVEELEQKIKNAGGFDLLGLEQELAEEKEAKKMLDEALIGQRRSLQERHEIFLQHSRILKRRQGVIDPEGDSDAIDLKPFKSEINKQIDTIKKQQQEIEAEVQETKHNINRLQIDIEQKNSQKSSLNERFDREEKQLLVSHGAVSKLESEITFYEEIVRPLRDSWQNVKVNLASIEELIQSGSSGSEHERIISEIDGIIKDLAGVPSKV